MSEKLRVRRHRVTIEQRIPQKDTLGGIWYDWQKVCTTWAEIKGDVVTIKYRDDIQVGMRVVIGSTELYVDHILDCRQGHLRLLELHVKDESGRRRNCPPGLRDEEQQLGAFPRSRRTQAAGIQKNETD